MKKTIYTNKNNGEKLELINKEGQLYTLKNEQGQEKQLYRIVLAKHFEMTEETIVENETTEVAEIETVVETTETNTGNTRNNAKHTTIKILNPKGVEMIFASIKEFANHIEAEQGRKINKGHLYNLVNGKSKSYLGYRIAQ